MYYVKNWPPAFTEWNTKAVRDAFYASLQFPRVTGGSAIQETIARGVSNCILAYVCKDVEGNYKPFYYGQKIMDQSDRHCQDHRSARIR